MGEYEIDLSRPASDIIAELKKKSITLESWQNLRKEYEPLEHDIVNDKIGRKDKVRSDGSIDKAARITLGLERLLVKRMVEFMFAIPVKRVYHNVEDNSIRKQIAQAMELIYKHARIDAENIKRGEMYFASCEMFTIWYTVEKQNTLYGFPSKYKLKCKTFSPMNGCELYPLFDERDDMLAQSFEYKKKIGDKEVTYFETFTSNKHYVWKHTSSGYELEDEQDISIRKIPGAYAFRLYSLYHGLKCIREEIEYAISRASDTLAYNSSPVLKVVGELSGGEDKGESRRIFRVENGGDVGYVSWSQSIEALKYQVETLLSMYWTQAQMPDVSFDNMAKLGNIGFDARQTVFTDAHLKVGDESGMWVEFFEREANVIKAFLGEMNIDFKSELDNVEVEHIITPFIQNDEKLEIEKWITASGGKAIMSQLDAIKNAGYSSNPEETLERINAEAAQESAVRMNSIMEGAM